MAVSISYRLRNMLGLLLVLSAVATCAQETFGDCPEVYTDLCLHGSCRLLISEHLALCTCSRGFVGSRCQYFDLLAVVSEDPNTQKIVVFAMIPVLVISVASTFCFCLHLCKCKKWSPTMIDYGCSECSAERTSANETMERLGRPVTYPFKSRPTRKPGTVTLNSPLRFRVDAERPQSKSAFRFGMLSHHSFFSRHNPHPQRVTHINGLNGMPVCTVNDDWYVNNPLSPHPLIKSQLTTTVLGMPGTRLPISIFQRNPMSDDRIPKFSAEAWREELCDFASKACLLIPEETEQIKEPEVRRSTQYSAQTGRLIPPGQAYCRASRHRAGNKNKYTSPFRDQELLVLDLLCQLLQTDSLSAVQQWLLCSAQREKDFVLGLVQSTLANSLPDYRQITDRAEERFNSQMNCNPLVSEHHMCNCNRKKHNSYYLKKKPERIEEEEPDHIGTAEVLQIHRSKSPHLNSGLQDVIESNKTTGNN